MDALAKLGIDGWGLLLYLVNFGVLLVLLQRYVYKPLTKWLDERRHVIKENVEKAQSLRAELDDQKSQEEQMRKQREQELEERISKAKSTARTEAKNMIMEAESQRDAILAKAAKTADETVASTIKSTEKEILERVKAVVSHVLEEGVPADVVAKSVEQSWKSLSK